MKLKHFLLSAGVLLLSSSAAVAGGYQLNDYSITGLGRSFAGAGVVGDDYSAIAYNPAGMMAVKRSGIQTGLTIVNLKSTITGLDNPTSPTYALGGGRDAGKKGRMDFNVPIPHFFGQYNVNDRLAIGLGVYTPFGLKTHYKADWFGADDAILSELQIVDIAPAIAYKLTDKWSVGASLIARYIYGHMTSNVQQAGMGFQDFELDGWTKTATLGTMYEFTPNTRVGLSWRLRSTQKVKGDHTISGEMMTGGAGLLNGTYNGWASPALPETFTLSAYHKYKKFGFSGTARWTHWSQSFPEFVMGSDSTMFAQALNGEKRSIYNYDNSWTLTAGVDYYYNDNWTFRMGTGYDESPVRNPENRTLRIPDADRIWASVGLSYMAKNWQVDVGYTHMFGKVGESREQGAFHHAKYNSLRSNIYGMQVQYKF